MFGVQDEYYFYQLLEGEKRQRLQSRLNSFRIESALDIGCGDGRALLGLHYVFAAKILRGCERSTQRGALGTSLGNALCETPRDLSEARYEIAKVHYDTRSRTEIDAHVVGLMKRVQYECDTAKFSPGMNNDAVICSQVLHYSQNESEVRFILEMIRTCAHTNSLIYFSIKDRYQQHRLNIVRGEVLVACCHEYMDQLGLKYFKGHECDEGNAHIFTNL